MTRWWSYAWTTLCGFNARGEIVAPIHASCFVCVTVDRRGRWAHRGGVQPVRETEHSSSRRTCRDNPPVVRGRLREAGCQADAYTNSRRRTTPRAQAGYVCVSVVGEGVTEGEGGRGGGTGRTECFESERLRWICSERSAARVVGPRRLSEHGFPLLRMPERHVHEDEGNKWHRGTLRVCPRRRARRV